MIHNINAIYDGVLRPVEPLNLPEGEDTDYRAYLAMPN
jgi:predicted DNA-binding antitoxin AbrB/MazE fold protein